jgi:hypothetical protein
MAKKKPKPAKPRLAIVKGVTVEDVVALYRALTGKEPTAAEVEQARRDLEGRAADPRGESRPHGSEGGDHSTAPGPGRAG